MSNQELENHLNTTSTSIYSRFIMVWSALPALLFLHTFAITIQYYPAITSPETAWCRWDLQCARTSRTGCLLITGIYTLAASSRGHLDQWRFKDDDAQHAAQEKTSIIIHRHLAGYGDLSPLRMASWISIGLSLGTMLPSINAVVLAPLSLLPASVGPPEQCLKP